MNDIVQSGGPGTAINQWDPNSGAALPAYLADALGDLGSNIPDRMTVPSLSYEGKTWTIIKDGVKTKMQVTNGDGDVVPVSVMRILILNANPDRGRAYYPGTYNPAASTPPACWSADGKAPDASVKEKQSPTCAGCPQSVKGSKVQEGREMVACSTHRMIAVAPAFDFEADPLRLKIAVTSDWDKEVVEHGWHAFRQYTDYLKSRGVAHTALVVTKVKFDPNTAYPKLLFALDRVLTQEETARLPAIVKNPKVEALLSEKWTAAGSAGTPSNESDIRPHGLEGAYADGWAAHPDAAGYSWKGTEVLTNAEVAAKYPAPEPAKAPPVPASEQVIEHAPQVAKVKTEPPAGTPMTAKERAVNEGGWRDHPDAPGYMYLGQEVLLEADVLAKFPAIAPKVEAAAPPPPPVAPPAPEVKTVDPIAAAEADGWVKHPDAPDYHYKGADVVLTTDVAAKYAGNAASASASPAAATTVAGGAPPSDAAIPADVQDLLSKWAG